MTDVEAPKKTTLEDLQKNIEDYAIRLGADTNLDGEVDLGEYIGFVGNLKSDLENSPGEYLGVAKDLLELCAKKLLRLDALDKNGDGKISTSEAVAFLKDLVRAMISKEIPLWKKVVGGVCIVALCGAAGYGLIKLW